jgi:hypothetical protein
MHNAAQPVRVTADLGMAGGPVTDEIAIDGADWIGGRHSNRLGRFDVCARLLSALRGGWPAA